MCIKRKPKIFFKEHTGKRYSQINNINDNEIILIGSAYCMSLQTILSFPDENDTAYDGQCFMWPGDS